MLLETVGDHQFAQNVQTIAQDAARKNGRKQYASPRIEGVDKLFRYIDRILNEADGHIDQVVTLHNSAYVEEGGLFMILYTANREVTL